jgi:hypothetical protein
VERISNRYHEDLPATTLYLDDISEIIDTFAQVCEQIEVSAGEYRITSSTELEMLAGKFPDGKFLDLEIRGRGPSVSLDLNAKGARIYISEDSIVQRGVIAKARELIERGRKFRLKYLVLVAYFGLCFVGVWQTSDKNYTLAVPAFLAALVFLTKGLDFASKITVVVYTKRRVEMKGFFERKKDDIFLAVISAVAGAALAYLVPKYLP